MHIKLKEAVSKLNNSGELFQEFFHHGSLVAELYKPVIKDFQKPHNRDEVYIILSGQGEFYSNGVTIYFMPGDFLFVPAGTDHYFLNFSNDFITWVLFYGPEGGEN